jgi:hypothetical protein
MKRPNNLKKLGRRHWPLSLTLLLFIGLSVTYNMILPLAEVSDAGAHFALIRFMAEEKRPPLTLEERTMIGIKGDASPLYHALVALLTQHVDVSTFPQLPTFNEDGRRAIPADQRMIQSVFHTEDEQFPYKGIVLAWHLAGLLSIPMGMATIIATYLITLALWPARPYLALAAATFVAFLPRFIVSSAVINDDNLAFPLMTFSLYLMVRILQGQTTRRTFMMLGALLGLAALTKYHSLLLLPEIALVMAYVAWRDRWGGSALLRRWGWVMVFFMVAAGWWLGFVIIKFNDIEALGLIPGLLAPFGDPVMTEGSPYLFSADFNPISIWEFDYWLSWTFRSFWLHYNGLDTGMEMIGRTQTYWLLYAGFGGLTLISLGGLLVRLKRHWAAGRPELLFLAFHFLFYLSLIILRYMLFPALSTSQGRHLYPALASIAIFFVLGLEEAWRLLPAPPNDKRLGGVIGATMFSLSLLIIPVYLLPVYYPLLPVASQHPDEAPIEHRLSHQFAEEIRFEGYNLPVETLEAGQPLPLNLYWRSRVRQARDYLVELCLRDERGKPVTCYQGHPAGGRYPLRAWEEGYLLRDTLFLPIPTCLASGQYSLTLTLLPLRLDTAATEIDPTLPPLERLDLTTVTLQEAAGTPSNRPTLWANGTELEPNSLVWQLRESLTLLNYQSSPAGSYFSSDSVGSRWDPLAMPTRYRCPNGVEVTTSVFIVHPGLQPGDYRLSEVDLPVRLHTRPRNFSVPAVAVETPFQVGFGNELTLLSYSVAPLSYRPGDTIEVTTVWQARQTMGQRYVGSFHLLDHSLKMWGQDDHPLGEDYPSTLWAPGEVITSVHKVPVLDYIVPGQYTLKLSVYAVAPDKLDFLPVLSPEKPDAGPDLYLGRVRIEDPATDAGPGHRLQVSLAKKIQLQGYDLTAASLSAGEPLGVRLYWQALTPLEADYTVFTQLLGPDARVWAQQDNQPQGGSFPTSTWPVHKTIIDRYNLALAEDAPQGSYQLLVGMYNLADGQRLPAIDAQGQRLYQDAVVIGPINFE